MIELTGLTKVFGNVRAVDGIDLLVRRGELFAFLGPNGAGKTTTIKMLVSLLRPTAGSISIMGRAVPGGWLEIKARLGYVPDQPFLYEKLTGREFLSFVCGMYGLRDEAERIGRIAPLFEIGPFLDALTETYSHGMRQRTALTAAFIHDPELLIVDEPIVGLDPHNVRLLKTVFRDFVDRGNTIFMSTHTLSLAEEIADRVGIIHRGRLLAVGDVREIKARSGEVEGLEEAFLKATADEEVDVPPPSPAPR